MLVLVFGLPGSGKSFFASRLASHLKAHYINSDVVRKEMHVEGQYSKEDKFRVYREMARRARIHLSAGDTVVVDATFYRNELRTMFADLARDVNVPIYLINVEADQDVVKERLSRPREHSEADYAVYKSVKEEFEEVRQKHLSLVSTNDNIDHMLRTALDNIRPSQ